jgi:hypothetical protein
MAIYRFRYSTHSKFVNARCMIEALRAVIDEARKDYGHAEHEVYEPHAIELLAHGDDVVDAPIRRQPVRKAKRKPAKKR